MIVAATVAACVPVPDKDYHGSVGTTDSSTYQTPAVPAYPVDVSGSGEQVKTADLVATGYTVAYKATSNCLIVSPVQADGSDGPAVVTHCASGDDPVSGTTTFHARGRTTLHVWNTDGNWALRFTPLS
ncbi:hypothetical protein [Mycobacterium sp. 94-17]|uniref:hypothetical protein n=1 Tax=Mycobacterium sp. 94-17 TaxID=2986147 RepID=UPI002D1ED10B|nr:hypothetical protein [Mycobacterium sp. 94-17]MEB4212335.1 hypothetical protein [Mycobacterium sp. 94-17]